MYQTNETIIHPRNVRDDWSHFSPRYYSLVEFQAKSTRINDMAHLNCFLRIQTQIDIFGFQLYRLSPVFCHDFQWNPKWEHTQHTWRRENARTAIITEIVCIFAVFAKKNYSPAPCCVHWSTFNNNIFVWLTADATEQNIGTAQRLHTNIFAT